MDDTLYKLILFGIAVTAFFLFENKKYKQVVRTALITATGLMTIVCVPVWGLMGLIMPAVSLGSGVGLAYLFSTVIPGFLKRFFPKFYYKGKLR